MYEVISDLPSWNMCPTEYIRSANRGAPDITGTEIAWLPYILQYREVWYHAAFYFILALLLKKCACWAYPLEGPRISVKVSAAAGFAAEANINREGGQQRCLTAPADDTATYVRKHKHDTVKRYIYPFIHAVRAVFYATAALVDTQKMVEGEACVTGVTQWHVLTHSFGYFIADMVVDRDPVYYSHHLGPLIYAEFMLRIGGPFYHAVWFGLACEAGNVICHSCALYTNTMGSVYPKVFLVTHFFSRFFSLVSAIFIIACDIPIVYGWFSAIAVICMLMVYCSNAAEFFRASASASASFTLSASTSGKNAGGAAVAAASSLSIGASKWFGFLGTGFQTKGSSSSTLPKEFYGPRIVHHSTSKYN